MTMDIVRGHAEANAAYASGVIAAGITDGSIGSLGVATGASPLPLYRLLRGVEAPASLSLFALDEYVGLDPQHPQSYSTFVRQEIAEPLGVDERRVHVPRGSAEDPAAAADEYEALLRQLGGVDLQIVGIGANGHLGFNEPGSSFDSRTRVVELTERTRSDNARYFEPPERVPTHAITQGIATIMSARRILLVASGPAKADAIARALAGPIDASCPASVLQRHPDVTVLLDDDAAAQLHPSLITRTSGVLS